jgi:hypothetical protein
MARGLFGDRRVDAIAVVEAPVSQSYARKARIAFLGVAAVAGVFATVVVAAFTDPAAAVLLGGLVGLVCGFAVAVLVYAWPVLRVLWWWSTEITIFAAVVFGSASLAHLTYPWLALTVDTVVAAVCGAVGPVRRRLVAWSWCVVVRHRLRLCFAEFVRAAQRTRPGCLPLVLWARPTPAGERVWLWLRPGLDLTDLEGRIGKLAVACWAGEVRVVRASQRYAALLRVDVARRDPLAGTVESPLAKLIPLPGKANEAGGPVSPVVPPVGLDLADVAEPAAEPRGGRR